MRDQEGGTGNCQYVGCSKWGTETYMDELGIKWEFCTRHCPTKMQQFNSKIFRGKKSKLNVTINEYLIELARENRLNISKLLELSLIEIFEKKILLEELKQ